MEELRLLIGVLNKKKLRYIAPIIGEKGTNRRLLYELLAGSKELSEKDIGEFIYPRGRHKDKQIRKLKSELKERLISAMMTANFNEKGYKKSYIKSFKTLAAVQILRTGASNNIKYSIKLAEEGIQKAKQLNLTNSILVYARILEYYYGALEGNSKKYEKYKSMVRGYNEMLYLETKAESYYVETITKYTKSRDISGILPESLDIYIEELKPYIFKYKSSKLGICVFNMEIMKYNVGREYNKVIEVAQEAMKYFNSLKGGFSYTFVFSFLYKTIPAYIHLLEFKKATKSIEDCLKITPKGSYNEVVTIYYKIILGFHSGRYELCYPSLQEINKYYNDFHKSFREQYRIGEAYVFFFIEIKAIQINETKKFRISKFLNEVPIFSKDKLGNNINILILQFLFLLNRKQYDWLIDKADSLKMYVSRYLKKEGETARSYYFIKMLVKISKSGFDKAKVKKMTVNDYKKLTATQSNPDTSRLTSEIVPYEVLWEKALAMLK